MDSDPSQSSVQPMPFEHGLTNLARRLQSMGPVKVVAIGSSSTAGEGGIVAYPQRLEALLRAQYPGATINVVNKGIGGEEAPAELERFDRDVIAEQPDLVIWQVGTNAVWQSPDQNPPSFEATTAAIREGLARLGTYGKADVILMDLQYVPAVLTPDKIAKTVAMVEAIGEIARTAGVDVFRRFALMKSWHEIEKIPFDRMVDPSDDARLHDSDWTTQRLAFALKEAIVGGMAKAQPVA